jgi:D-serine deaminase-like pyridoxal phosphate-dependent protein
MEAAADRYARYLRAIADELLPVAFVDLDAFEANIDQVVAPVRAAGKRFRLASKSVRSPKLLDAIMKRAGECARGLMTYTAAETAFLAEQGFEDLLLAYPTVRAADAKLLAEANRRTRASVMIDSAEQLEPLAHAAREAGVTIPVVIELDVAYRRAGLYMGVRRSPLKSPDEVVSLAEQAAATSGLRFAGIMAYEAQIAGLTDDSPYHAWQNLPRRALKRLSRGNVEKSRAQVVEALRARGLPCELVNGGGTGSVGWAASEAALTEVTAGSGFLVGHLFDYYAHMTLRPALHFALQVVRRPMRGMVTCHGGGYIASGGSGPDRLPVPSLPEGCTLLPMEGAGEVQTPVKLPPGIDLRLGDAVFFRPAKSGELAEHFNHYLLIRGDRVEDRVPTYRGLGRTFLG